MLTTLEASEPVTVPFTSSISEYFTLSRLLIEEISYKCSLSYPTTGSVQSGVMVGLCPAIVS